MKRFTTSGAARTFLTVTLVMMLCAGIAMAQRIDGTLRGTVTDASGAVVAGAQVTATNQATGVSNTTTTTSAGSYEFPNLLIGPYTITVENKGFQKYVRKDIEVRSNQVTEASARMAIGTADTVVEVTAGADVVQTTNSQLANTFDARQIVNLPVPNVLGANGVLNLAVLAPNTTSVGGGVIGQGGSIGGARPRMNNFTVDGLDDNRVDITGSSSNVVQDAIAEFTLITNQFSAEYGHSAGGQFNVVTKGGTNNWHGSAFHFNQNKNYNAMDNIEKQGQRCPGFVPVEEEDPNCDNARNDFNQAGGSVGGPIIKNRVFIFGAYQKVWAGFAGSSTPVTAPTAAGIQALRGIAANSAITDILDEFEPAPGATESVLVTNNQTGAQATVDLGSVSFLAPSVFDERDYHINGDLVFTQHQVHMRYLNNHQVQPNLSDPPIPKFSGDEALDVHKATISDVWTVTPRFVNDLRLGYTRFFQTLTVPEQYSNFPNIFVESLSNFQLGPEGTSPQGGGQNVYQALDQMSYATGPHSFKWGYEYRRWIAPGGFLPRARGEWRYETLDDFVSDQVPISFAKRGAGTGAVDGNQTAHFGFFQDDWKVTPRLTLNLGLRYEWFGIPNMAKTQVLNSISDCPECGDFADLIFRVPTTDTNNFAPRIGFAWDMFGDGKTALRGGFGMSYDVIPQNFPTLQLPPQLQSEQDPAITCALPGAPAWCADFVGGSGLGFGFLQGGGLLQVNIEPANQAEARANTQGIMRDQVMPRVTTWTLSLQREVFRNSSVELRYLGTRGMRLPIQRQVNSISAFDNGAQPLPTFFSQGAVPTSFAGAPTLAQFNALRVVPATGANRPLFPFGFVGGVTAFEDAGDSIYHSGSVDFIHRMTRGIYFRGNYTWAHAIDNSTNELFSSSVNPRRAEDVNHLAAERGRSVLDIRHKAALSWVYEVPNAPIENGFARGVLNGWQLNGTYVIQTGQPVTALSFIDANGNGDTAGDRAIRNASGDPNVGTTASTVCWNGAAVSFGCTAAAQIVGYVADDPTAGFVQARLGTLTNTGRNNLESPGRNNVDLSIFKNFKFTESMNLQFRAEFINVLNHAQYTFANPGAFAIEGIDDSAVNAAAYTNPALVASPNPALVANFLNERQLNSGNRGLTLGLKFIF
jgi:hypothetical protein